ncbi:MAG: hypothetical protein ACLTLK_05200 [Oscillospiraceae bacterium]
MIYCDPPYYKAEAATRWSFPRRIISGSMMYWSPVKDTVIVSYNYQDYICEIYQELLYLPRSPSQQHVPDGRQRI